MQAKRWVKLVGGAAAIGLVVAAMVWLVVPGRGSVRPSGRPLSMAGFSGATGHSQEAAGALAGAGPIVILPDKVDLSPPLRDIPPFVSPPTEETLIRFREGPLPGHERGSFSGVNSTLQDWHGVDAMPSPIQNWAGIDNTGYTVRPPDTQGDVGLNHYIQWVNLRFRIWNKSGTSLYGPALGNTIWSGFGGKCATYNDGDPVTLYDHLADRWVMMQFAVSGTGSDLICIAVSQTADPTGSWHRYSYTWPNTYMPDYPKLGLWPDGYYMTVNQFSLAGRWRGAGVAAFQRSAMLTGGTPLVIYYNLYNYNPAYGGMLPADWEGTAQPPSGAPCPFMEWDDSAWIGPSDAVRIWNFHVDWNTPANSYFGVSLDPNYTLPTADVDPTICSPSPCIDQPGTSQNLDEISDRLMHRLQYRNFAGYQAMVTNHTVDSNNPAGIAGIHWFELRNTGSGWTIYQQGTYAPNDGINRWMGSIAMDQSGNMALGFSASGSAIYPGIRYVGRLSTDTPGTMPQAEAVLQAGGGYQSDSYARWGDYSAMQVDPSDSCTFWYTTEYAATNGAYNWFTRIGAFTFGTGLCGPTAVELARFEGWPEGRAAHIEWETVTEIDNLGFNLYRADAAGGLYVKLNEELIPSQAPGSPIGAVYVWLDQGVEVGQTYYYKLQDVNIHGYTMMHGPVVVMVGPTVRGKP